MIKYSEQLELPVAADQLLSYLQRMTVQPYKPLSCGYSYCWELQNLPDFRLIEGVVVPPHGNEGPFYRPILMLHNPSNNYIIRGVDQDYSPQKAGTLIILDIDAQHEARSEDPNTKFDPWSGLVWGLGGENAVPKRDWSIEDTAEIAKQEILNLCTTIQDEPN